MNDVSHVERAAGAPIAETDAAMSKCAAPAWFRWAIERAGVSRYADVDGARIHYLSWSLDDADKPALVFVHGFRGHAHWWDHIAPYFASTHRVVALDLSGMGDSDHRRHYDTLTAARDIAGIIEAAGLAPAIVIGHSFGGSRVLRACAEWPGLFRRVVIVDSYVVFKGVNDHPRDPARLRGDRVYADLALAQSRYRLMPDQPATPPFILDRLARYSLRTAEGGWRWKFDPQMPTGALREDDGDTLLARIQRPVDYVYGERSAVVNPTLAGLILDGLKNAPEVRGPVIIPDGHHHLMVDQPIALIGTLRALLA